MTITDDAMVQMNVRMPSSLKKKGDAALQAAGYSPSQAVRALWAYAADHEDEPSALEQVLKDLLEEDERRKRRARFERMEARLRQRWQTDRELFGPLDWESMPSDEELYEQALLEKYGEEQTQ